MTAPAAGNLPQATALENEPIINSSYRQPQWHWQLNRAAKAVSPARPGRRIAQNLSPLAGSRAQWLPLEMVNRIRRQVADYPAKSYDSLERVDKFPIGAIPQPLGAVSVPISETNSAAGTDENGGTSTRFRRKPE